MGIGLGWLSGIGNRRWDRVEVGIGIGFSAEENKGKGVIVHDHRH